VNISEVINIQLALGYCSQTYK